MKKVAIAVLIAFLAAIAAVFGTAAGNRLLERLPQAPGLVSSAAYLLAPSPRLVRPISDSLFAVGFVSLFLSFYIPRFKSRLRARRLAVRIETLRKSLADGSRKRESITIEEMILLDDGLPKQPWKHEKDLEAGIKARIDQMYP